MKKHIILFVDSGLYGGIESHIVQLSKLLQDHQFDLKVLFYQEHSNVFLYNQLKRHHVKYHVLNGKLLTLFSYLKNQSYPYILHTHGYKAGILGRLICKCIARPCVSTFHAGETGTGKVKIYNQLDKLTSSLSVNFAVSDQIAKTISNATILDNFVSPKEFNYISPSEKIKIGFVGRLSFEKGPDIFIQVAQQFINNDIFSFHIYGDGPMMQQLKDRAPNNVTFHGHQESKSIWMNIDVFMISSRQEGLPLALLEAVNNCTAVISTQVGAVNKVIEHQLDGLISNDISSQSLSSSLLTWLQLNDKQKLLLIKNAYDRVAKYFSGKQQLKLLIDGYSQAIKTSSNNFQ